MKGMKNFIDINQFKFLAKQDKINDNKIKVVLYLITEQNTDTFNFKMTLIPSINIYGESDLIIHRYFPVNNLEEGKVRAFHKNDTIAKFLYELNILQIKYEVITTNDFIKDFQSAQNYIDKLYKEAGLSKSKKVKVKVVEETKADKPETSKKQNKTKEKQVEESPLTFVGETDNGTIERKEKINLEVLQESEDLPDLG